MKKLVYSLALVLMGLVSCTSFDDPVTENYGAGPEVQVNLTAGLPTDSAFVMSITPAAGTLYYAYVIDAADEPETLDAQTLLKGGYGNSVLKVTPESPSFNTTVGNLAPNTTYQVYAVAANDKGVTGKVAVASITTSDGLVPGPAGFKATADKKTMDIQFSEAITRGTGAVKVQYYAEWDILNPVTVAAEDMTVTVAKNVVTVVTPNIPDGAYVTYSWDEGAFVDGKGNKCRAFTSGLNMSTGRFTGVNMRIPTVAFEVTDEQVTAPKAGSLFDNWEEFQGEITFDKNIYRNDRTVDDGDVSVVYTNAKRTVIYKLDADQWSIDGTKLLFTLPSAPAPGDMVSVNLVEGAISDVYGNPNTAFESETSWQFFAPTKDMVFGTFKFTYTSAYDETPELYDGGTVTITEDPEKENGIIVSNLFEGGEGFELEGHYDLSSAKVVIDAFQIVAQDEYQGETIYLVLYNLSQTDEVAFTINADGTLTSNEMGLVAYNSDLTGALGWWEKCATAKLTPATAAAKAKSFKAAAAKTLKVAAKKGNFKHIVRK